MNNSNLLIYQTSDGKIKVDVRLEDEMVWLTQAHMAELFGKGRSTITEHIQNIFDERELVEELVCRNFRQTTQHGAIEGKTQSKDVKYYNLDLITELQELIREIRVSERFSYPKIKTSIQPVLLQAGM